MSRSLRYYFCIIIKIEYHLEEGELSCMCKRETIVWWQPYLREVDKEKGRKEETIGMSEKAEAGIQ